MKNEPKKIKCTDCNGTGKKLEKNVRNVTVQEK